MQKTAVAVSVNLQPQTPVYPIKTPFTQTTPKHPSTHKKGRAPPKHVSYLQSSSLHTPLSSNGHMITFGSTRRRFAVPAAAAPATTAARLTPGDTPSSGSDGANGAPFRFPPAAALSVFDRPPAILGGRRSAARANRFWGGGGRAKVASV